MSLHTEWVRFGAGGAHIGYLAYPDRAPLPLPGILVIQEAWGVDAYLERVVQRLALAGYAAFAPDLYSHDGIRPPALARERIAQLQAFVNELPTGVWLDKDARDRALDQLAEPARSVLRETHQAFQFAVASDKHLEPLVAASRYLRTEQRATLGQKVGSVGFCLGGGLSALLAAKDPEIAAAVIFYGVSPPEALVPDIKAPILGFYGEHDPRINGTLPGFVSAVERHGKRFEHHVYLGASHAFFNDNRPSYNLAASRDAYVRLLAFFQKHLT